jgi:hypothetical protein
MTKTLSLGGRLRIVAILVSSYFSVPHFSVWSRQPLDRKMWDRKMNTRSTKPKLL